MSAITAAKSAPKVIPPSSPFGELLRRSRFAAYDPAIRQTYSAPPSYAQRGNWGLKRPIANRSKRGSIVLRKFEEHAQYIEWDRADHQVKVVKAVEEMNTAPGIVPQTSWFIGLGQAATSAETGFDSDFCPGESSQFVRYRDERYADEAGPHNAPGKKLEAQVDWSGILPSAVNLDTLGQGGKGAYGAKTPLPSVLARRADDALLQPNINAMTPIEFKKYVESLRKLRPQFIQYVREQLQKDQDKGKNHQRRSPINPKDLSDEALILQLGQEARAKYLHMAFLGRHTEDHMYKSESQIEDPEKAAAMANRPSPIRQQPHKLGGLMYAMPTALESFFSVKPQPGLVLQDTSASAHNTDTEGSYLAAFGPMTVNLPKRNAGTAVMPLYSPFSSSPNPGLQGPRMPDPERPGKTIIDSSRSEEKMRVYSIQVEETPTVVGEDATNRPLSQTRLRASVVVESAMTQMFRQNPHTPGSREYNALLPQGSRISTSVGMYPQSRKRIYDKKLSNIRGRLPGAGGETKPISGERSTAATLRSLKDLLGPNSGKKPSYRAANVTEPEPTAAEDK
ncbi:hypothetical protein CVT25_009815 [Psilocybe cyanescens]|uniref:Uncharacterized protein n=1 Tax=Psilocybe cyanescens TaxID=93625 RepID=A0A409X813_PSICY|nr:hypothetical protein CVT25_009815 [Psilocybe cyanescens]